MFIVINVLLDFQDWLRAGLYSGLTLLRAVDLGDTSSWDTFSLSLSCVAFGPASTERFPPPNIYQTLLEHLNEQLKRAEN